MRSEEPLVSPASDYYTYHPSALASQVYLYPVSTGCFFYEPGYSLQRSRFDSFLLMYIAKGSCRFLGENGDMMTAHAGQYVLMDCYQPQAYSFDVASEVWWLHFDGCYARNYYEQLLQMHGQILGSKATASPAAGLKSILELFRTSRPLREAQVSNTINSMLQVLLENGSDDTKISSRTHVIETARSYISEYYAQQITLDDLARKAHMSPYHFTRVFAAETGMTPHQYLIAARLSAARYLLSSPAMPSVKEISLQCGFSSESSFCTTFRKWEGKTPSEYRQAAFAGSARIL